MTLEQHSKFFDHLVDLIPAKHYVEQDPDAQLNTRYLKKGEKAAVKRQLKEKHKSNKRAKLDPDAAQTTLGVQQQQAQQRQQGAVQRKQAAAAPDDAEDAGTTGRVPLASKRLKLSADAGREAAVGELHDRLQKRLQAMRRQRKAVEGQQRVAQAKAWREQAAAKSAARLKEAQRREAAQKRKAGSGGEQPAKKQKQGKPAQRNGADGDAELAFGRLELGTDTKPGPKAKRDKKPSKAELLAAAEAKQAQRGSGEPDQQSKASSKSEAWQAALLRARGEKVLDDPKLLRRSLKKEAKLKAKKSAAWQDRLARQKQEQAAKQAKRTENLQARAQTKADNKKAKREKKLMRAGFEGRREGFISKG